MSFVLLVQPRNWRLCWAEFEKLVAIRSKLHWVVRALDLFYSALMGFRPFHLKCGAPRTGPPRHKGLSWALKVRRAALISESHLPHQAMRGKNR